MPDLRHDEEHPLATLDHDGCRYAVAVRTSYDGIEYVGRLWFVPEGEAGSPDRGLFPGREPAEVLAAVRRLSPAELEQRLRRALAEKRRYGELRRATDEVLTNIRYLNQLAIAMRAGLLDVRGAAQEIDVTEQQLHDLVTKIRLFAGVEG